MNQPIEVDIDLSNSKTQCFTVRITWKPKAKDQKFSLPIWTPGSYTVRDHSQYLNRLRLLQRGKLIPVIRSNPNSWNCSLQINELCELSYFIEARNLTVRTCYLDDELASLCLAAAIVEIDGFRDSQYILTVDKPDDWNVYIPLVAENNSYKTNNFDELIDTPVHAGKHTLMDFKVDSYDHKLILIGKQPSNLKTSFLSDVSSICESTCNLMHSAPPAANLYHFFLQILDEGYGGLEHDNSSVLQFSWKQLNKKDGYRKLLQLIGHEYLHQWNIRRLRPLDYLKYNYSQAVITDTLWFGEGITSYFDLVIPFIAGITSREDLINDISNEINRYLLTPGRKVQSLADSSREAWVKLYKSSLASRNTQVSYYNLGALVAFLLDILLRTKSSSLSSLLRKMWNKYGIKSIGYSNADILREVSAIDMEIGNSLNSWIYEKDSLKFDEILALVGLRLEENIEDNSNFGLTIGDRSGCIRIENIDSTGKFFHSDLAIGDIILGINNYHIMCVEDFYSILRTSQNITIQFVRRGQIRKTLLNDFDFNQNKYNLVYDESATDFAKQIRTSLFEFL